MMNERGHSKPFMELGNQLRTLRERCKESLFETSGAIEIEPEQLRDIEEGKKRPSEDILLLLISHFDTQEELADRLWNLAGYDRDDTINNGQNEQLMQSLQGIVVLMDMRTAYSDMVQVSANDRGVIVNFLQVAGSGKQPNVVSRVGMSREQAKIVAEALSEALKPRPPRQLSAGDSGK